MYKTLSQYNKREHHFCSNKCQSLKKRELAFEHRKCEICGSDIFVSKNSSQRFCSSKCQNIWQLGNTGLNNKRFRGGYVKCESCGKEFLVGKYVLESNRKHFCSTDCRRRWYSDVWSQSDVWRNESRIRAVSILSNNPVVTQTRPQIITNNLLSELSITFRNEEPFVYFSIDNYLPDFNLAIEVMGDYWHSSPLKYPEKINDRQSHIISRDKAKHTYIKNCFGFEILYLWESDLLNRPDVCYKLIEKYIQSGGELDNYHSFNYWIDDGMIKINSKIIYPHQDRDLKNRMLMS